MLRSAMLAGLAGLSLTAGIGLLSTVAAEDETPTATLASQRPFLGVYTENTTAGLSVTRVIPGTTAATAGIREGDVLVQFGETTIANQDDLRAALSGVVVGDQARIGIRRDNELYAFDATMQARPDPAQQVQQIRDLGERIQTLEREREQLRTELGVLEGQGSGGATADLGSAMLQLANTLETLPDQLQQAARDFKAVYPDGDFTIRIEIDIRSAGEDAVINLGPGTVEPSPEAPEAP